MSFKTLKAFGYLPWHCHVSLGFITCFPYAHRWGPLGLGDQGVSWYEETTEDSSHGSLRSMCCERSMAPGEACHDVLLG